MNVIVLVREEDCIKVCGRMFCGQPKKAYDNAPCP